jgi:pescadillo protein
LYITRTQAIKKLQLTLKDFRRLCILKGIYPRESRNKKALARNKSYYLVKDIVFLAHEPILRKFREIKAFLKKMRRATAKHEPSTVRQLKLHKPVYTLDHLVKERYPTFIDAIHDLDDALCLIFLFAQMPKSRTVVYEVIEDCRRLSKEFMLYVAHTHSLRKVFLSIQGIYYQADIKGQSITWITPYAFRHQVNI